MSSSLNLQQLSTFCTVVHEGSMTAAAARLYLTQPAISQQIRHLEEQIGAELLVRGTRQVKPTLQGQLLFDYAKRIIALSQQAEIAMRAANLGVNGTLRVGTLNSLGMAIVSPLVGSLLKNNSGLRLKLNYGSGEEVVRAFESGDVDLVVMPDAEREFELSLKNAEEHFLFRDDVKLVGSGRDPHLPRKIAFSEFGSRPVAVYHEKVPCFEALVVKELKKCNATIRPVFETNNLGTLKRVLETGMGWAFMPLHSIHKQLRSGRLQVVNIEGFEYAMDVKLYSRKNKELQPIIDLFQRALQQQIISLEI